MWLVNCFLLSFLQFSSGISRIFFHEECLPYNIENQDRYICDDTGAIVCLDGWMGEDCNTPLCNTDCGSRGSCVAPDTCSCDMGYYGRHCQHCIRRPGCKHGTCEKSFECNCEEGWEGVQCSEPICAEGCHRHHGTCQFPGDCNCRRGSTGQNCTECVTMPECVHGTCLKPFDCLCLDGWTGRFCDQPICENSCKEGHGVCRAPNKCECEVGYSGEQCEKPICYPGCQNGSCKEPWECNCEQGWEGFLCDVKSSNSTVGKDKKNEKKDEKLDDVDHNSDLDEETNTETTNEKINTDKDDEVKNFHTTEYTTKPADHKHTASDTFVLTTPSKTEVDTSVTDHHPEHVTFGPHGSNVLHKNVTVTNASLANKTSDRYTGEHKSEDDAWATTVMF